MWLSLARAPGLGPGGRRFESCHPDFVKQHGDAAFFCASFLDKIIGKFNENNIFIEFTNEI